MPDFNFADGIIDHLAVHRLHGNIVTHHNHFDGFRQSGAHDSKLGLGSLGAADFNNGLGQGKPVQGFPVDGKNHVIGPQARFLRRGALDGGDDGHLAVIQRYLRSDPLERGMDGIVKLLGLFRVHVAGERILQSIHHAVNGTVHKLVMIHLIEIFGADQIKSGGKLL
ncbi:hypothetical protein D3C75_713840 [compost metagenome]